MNTVPLPLASSSAHHCVAGRSEIAHRIFHAPRALAFWHLASLDAPTVAVVWSLAFAWTGGIHLPLWVPMLLALVTWSVYVADRLLDARAGLREPVRHTLRERHRFHWRYRRALMPMAIAAACAAAAIILAFMPPMARARDSVLAAAALAYFSGVHSGHNARQFPLQWPRVFPGKEFLVGVLFTAGCVLPAWHRPHALATPGSAVWVFWIPAVFFAALAWLNCSCIARWESTDNSYGSRNKSVLLGGRTLHKAPGEAVEACPEQRRRGPACCDDGPSRSLHSIALVLAGIGLLLCLLSAALAGQRPAMLLAAGATSALLLALLDRTRAHIAPLALRAAADLVLLTPLALLFLSWALK